MSRYQSIAGLCLAAWLTGCASGAELSASQSLDPDRSAELEFVKGHLKAGLGHAGVETFTVCSTPDCRQNRFYVGLTWTTPDSIVRRAPAGEVTIKAHASNMVGTFMKTCRLTVRFNVDAGHSYVVEVVNLSSASSCVFTVQDKSTGAAVPVAKVSPS
jgi:hypothetical protein